MIYHKFPCIFALSFLAVSVSILSNNSDNLFLLLWSCSCRLMLVFRSSLFKVSGVWNFGFFC